MNAAIFTVDPFAAAGQKYKAVENFQFETIEQVKARVKELQEASWCEGNEKATVGLSETIRKRDGKKIKVVYAESEVDFQHAAFLGQKIKQ